MSDQHTTSEHTDEQVRETVAAVGFMAVLAAMAGGLGLVIAAMAVGAERAWTGRHRRDGGDGSAGGGWRRAIGEGWRQAVADQRAWLELDRGRRRAWRGARRQWWQAGAEAGSRPRQPAAGIRAGRWARRAWARVAVAADRVAAAAGRAAVAAGRFRRGWREGWTVANQVRRDGGGFRDIASARPEQPPGPEPQPQPGSLPADAAESDQPAGDGTPPETPPPPGPPPRGETPPRMFRPPPAQAAGPRACPYCDQDVFAEPPRYWRRSDWGPPTGWSHPDREPTCPKTGQPYRPTTEPPPASTPGAPAGSTIDGCGRCGADVPVLYSTDDGGWECLDCVTQAAPQATPDPGRPALPAGPTPNTTTTDSTDSGGVMSAPAITAGTTAPGGETNLDLTVADLAAIHHELDGINEQIDVLAQRRTNLQARIAAASERVQATGGTAATAQALDAATAVADELGQHLGNFSASATEASDVTAAAEAGLVPARDAQDELHAAGARGEFVSAATD